MAVTRVHMEENCPYSRPRAWQGEAFGFIADNDLNALIQAPTGEGKTVVGASVLRACSAQGQGPLYYITPTKAQLDQVRREVGERRSLPVLGRAEHECNYYAERGMPGVTAQESPCYMLLCPHRVDQETGETAVPGVEPCHYFQQKYEARRAALSGGIVVCTTAFFLTNRLMVAGWRDDKPALVVVDEVHRLAKIARGVFEWTMTDFHLKRAADILAEFDKRQAAIIRLFRARFMTIARRRVARSPSLLEENEIQDLLGILEKLDEKVVLERVRNAMASGRLDPVKDKTEIKLLETLARTIPRFVHSLRFALEEEDRKPLNYVVAFHYRKDDPEIEGSERRRARYYLTIRSYFVVPIIRKALGRNVLAYSATVGDPVHLKFETGINPPFKDFGSHFPVANTRIYVPSDTRDLAQARRRRQDLNKTLRRIVEMARTFARKGHRSLAVVVSEEERQKLLRFAAEAGLETVSYGNGVSARAAAERFRGGEGAVLVGTVAQYGEGVDLPKQMAPVIFFLRPGYPRPDDPEAQFEERRFSRGTVWALRNWRVTIEALQARGRNVRTNRDLGVCFFMSQQFRRFLFGALPEWLRPAYRKDMTADQCVADALKLLG